MPSNIDPHIKNSTQEAILKTKPLSDTDFIALFGVESLSKEQKESILSVMRHNSLSYETIKDAVGVAAKNNQIEKLKILFTPGSSAGWDDIISHESTLSRALCSAAWEGHEEIIDYLLTDPKLLRKASLSDKSYRVIGFMAQKQNETLFDKLLNLLSKSETDNSEFVRALEHGLECFIMRQGVMPCVDRINFLVFHPKLNSYWNQKRVQNLFLTCARAGSVENMRYLCENANLKYKAIPASEIIGHNWQETSPLLKVGVNSNTVWGFSQTLDFSFVDKDKLLTPIHEAFLNVCESGSIPALHYLLSKGVKPHSFGIIVLAHLGHLEFLKELLKIEPNLNANVLGAKALFQAAEKNHNTMIDYLLSSNDIKPENRPKPRSQDDKLFKICCRQGNIDMVKRLVSNYLVLPEEKSLKNLYFILGYPPYSINRFLATTNFHEKKEILSYIQETQAVKAERDHLSKVLSKTKKIEQSTTPSQNAPKKKSSVNKL